MSVVLPRPIIAFGTDSAGRADTELSIYFDSAEMDVIRRKVEQIRTGIVGAHTYILAIEQLGWAHKLFNRMHYRRKFNKP